MQNISQVLQHDPLVRLVQVENFVGWVYSIDYDRALVMTNDLWKQNVSGIPQNSFLVASSFNPNDFQNALEAEREVILLRVVGASKLPQDDDLVQTKIDSFQDQISVLPDNGRASRDLDDITASQLQFGGLNCRVLGTFYIRDAKLMLGSDIESFATAARLRVYRPQGSALAAIVNFVDPIRLAKAREDEELLGAKKPISPFRIGTVRYTSTDRLHRRVDEDKVAVSVQPSDFLGRRTAVLGMTRTGKSNMVKQLVAVVKRVSTEVGFPIGQIIYDINGEYANANGQDQGSLADVFPKDSVRYRMLRTEGFEELGNNFYEQINEGFGIIQRELDDANRVTTDYVRAFVSMSLDEPDKQEYEEHHKWACRVAAYRCILHKAGFEAPKNHRIRFKVNKDVIERVNKYAGIELPDPDSGLTLPQAVEWFEAARGANREQALPSSTKGRLWADDTLVNLMDMIVQKGANNSFISGYRILSDSIKYHSPRRTREVGEEIYEHLTKGRLVILDLSVGDPTIREKTSRDVAGKIFAMSMDAFIKGRTPPSIVVYIEEAHNLIGKGMELTETWPRLAKEGAKYRIALVYATQEVSSVHPNILANTENWFVTHLNNQREIAELARFYDFEDFGRTLIRAQDVGFARVKTLSGPFVIPVQIDKFTPSDHKE